MKHTQGYVLYGLGLCEINAQSNLLRPHRVLTTQLHATWRGGLRWWGGCPPIPTRALTRSQRWCRRLRWVFTLSGNTLHLKEVPQANLSHAIRTGEDGQIHSVECWAIRQYRATRRFEIFDVRDTKLYIKPIHRKIQLFRSLPGCPTTKSYNACCHMHREQIWWDFRGQVSLLHLFIFYQLQEDTYDIFSQCLKKRSRIKELLKAYYTK